MHILLVNTLGYLCLCHYTPKKEMKKAPDYIKKLNLKLNIKKSKIKFTKYKYNTKIAIYIVKIIKPEFDFYQFLTMISFLYRESQER